ncbi:MAG TPA: hypothetical protein VGN26_13415 [Armatimonadota bacterium]
MPRYEWFTAGVEVRDRFPGLELDGHPLDSGLWLTLLNTEERGARANLWFYTTDLAPTRCKVSVAPQRAYRLALHSLEDRPASNRPFAIRVESDRYLTPQLEQRYYRPWAQTEQTSFRESLEAAPRAGAETEGGAVQSSPPHAACRAEQTLAFLNPGGEPATLDLHLHRGDSHSTSSIEVCPQRLMVCSVTELLGEAQGGAPAPLTGASFRSQLPVVARLTTHWYQPGDPAPVLVERSTSGRRIEGDPLSTEWRLSGGPLRSCSRGEALEEIDLLNPGAEPLEVRAYLFLPARLLERLVVVEPGGSLSLLMRGAVPPEATYGLRLQGSHPFAARHLRWRPGDRLPVDGGTPHPLGPLEGFVDRSAWPRHDVPRQEKESEQWHAAEPPQPAP